MKIMYVDVETTGLDFKDNCIWQLAGLVEDTEKHEKDYFDFKIAPYKAGPHSRTALEIGGISAADLKNFPDARQAYDSFTELIRKYVNPYNKKDKLYFCAYNAAFDSQFVREFLTHFGDVYYGSYFWHPYLDVMQLAGWFYTGKFSTLKNFKLTTLYEHVLGKPFDDAHNAMSDILATKELMDYFVENYNLFKKEV